MPNRRENGGPPHGLALWILTTIAVLFFVRAAASLLIPIVIAVLISFALEPVVAWMHRQRLPRTAAAAITMTTLLGLMGWGAYSLRDEATSAVEALPTMVDKARNLVSSVATGGTGNRLQQSAAGLQRFDSGADTPREPGTKPATGSGGSQPAIGTSGSLGVTSILRQGVTSIFSLAGNVVVVVFLVFFLLVSGHHVRNRLVEVAGPDAGRRQIMATIVDEIDGQIERFLLVRLVTAVVVGLLTWLALGWMGVQNAAIWGILAGLFNSIPYFGPIIVSGGLFLVGLVQGGGLTQALQMSAVALAITSLEGWLITPPLMGKAERMSALAVFLGLLLWTWAWGAWGTLLAVPMLVVLKSVADHIERLKPIGRLLAP
jgi:predicted PurR-regulated permease PerM